MKNTSIENLNPLSRDPDGNTLFLFIAEKMKNYQDPVREGKSRGEPIGFPRNKTLSCLLMLTDHSLKKIAEYAEVSYGLLKKWRTENDFKERHERFAREFVDKVFDDITRLCKPEDSHYVENFARILKGVGCCHKALLEYIANKNEFKLALIHYSLLTDTYDFLNFNLAEIEKDANRQFREQGVINIPGVKFTEKKFGRFK